MTEKGFSKVAISPNRKLYEQLHDEKGWGMVRLKNKALELGENISTQCFWQYFKRTDRGYHPSIEKKKDAWGWADTSGDSSEGGMKDFNELR